MSTGRKESIKEVGKEYKKEKKVILTNLWAKSLVESIELLEEKIRASTN